MTDEKTLKPGVYPGIPNADYHGGPGVSKSGLDLIRRSPMHYWHAMQAANDNDPTPAQMIGAAFHCLLLEPDVFVKEYCLGLRREDEPHAIDDRDQLVAMVQDLNAKRLPKLSSSGNKADLVARILENKLQPDLPATDLDDMKALELRTIIEQENEKRPGRLPISGSRHELAFLLRENGVDVTLWSDVLAQWLENNGHRTVLTQDQWDQLHAMRDAVMADPYTRSLMLGDGLAEHSVYWRDGETGELCRCRPDWWRTDLNLLVDVKTCEDASEEGFAKSVANWRYHVQAPFYLDGVESATGKRPQAFVFLCVEKKPPYAVAAYRLGDESQEIGRMEYRQDLQRYAECRQLAQWPGYGGKIRMLDLPGWYFARVDRRINQ